MIRKAESIDYAHCRLADFSAQFGDFGTGNVHLFGSIVMVFEEEGGVLVDAPYTVQLADLCQNVNNSIAGILSLGEFLESRGEAAINMASGVDLRRTA